MRGDVRATQAANFSALSGAEKVPRPHLDPSQCWSPSACRPQCYMCSGSVRRGVVCFAVAAGPTDQDVGVVPRMVIRINLTFRMVAVRRHQ